MSPYEAQPVLFTVFGCAKKTSAFKFLLLAVYGVSKPQKKEMMSMGKTKVRNDYKLPGKSIIYSLDACRGVLNSGTRIFCGA